MGVSVSASTAIIVAGAFVAFTAFYPVAANGFDRVTESERGVHERALERQNTELTLTSAEYNTSTDELVVRADNDGSVGLVVSDTTLVVDNEYVDIASPATRTSVAGTADTDLWLDGETLTITVSDSGTDVDLANASRVVVAAESGVRDAGDVTEVS